MWAKSLLVFSTLFVVFHISKAAYDLKQCYECEHFDGPSKAIGENPNPEKCKDSPTPEEFLKTCAEKDATVKEWQCIKVVGRIEYEDENYNYIKRGCSPGKTYDSCKECKNTKTYETQYGYVKKGKVCVCDESDGCNAGAGLSVSTITVILGILFAVFSKF